MRRPSPIALSTLAAIFVLSFACPRLLSQSASQDGPLGSVYSQDGYGLEKELQPFLNAYANSDPAIDDTLSILVIPEADSWFGNRFPKDTIQGLVDDQKAVLAKLKQQLLGNISKWPKGTHFQVSCKKYSPSNRTALVEPRPDAIRPTGQVRFEVEQYQITYIADTPSPEGNKWFSNVDNFVYVAGAYRFVGGGAYAFWLMPDLSARPKSAAAPLLSPTVQAEYADSSSGLRRLMQDALNLAKKNDQNKLTALTNSMVLPDPAAYFARVFGPEIGAVYTRGYMLQISVIPGQAIHFFQDAVKKQFTSVDVIRFTSACDDRADEKEYPLLLLRQGEEPLSEVRFSHENSYSFTRYLAYVDGGFRFLGNLDPISNPAFSPSPSLTPSRIKVSGDSLQANLIKQVQPIYPEEARQHFFQGEVILHVLISPDGAPTDFQIIQGRCSLAKAATDAVRQWRYSPTLRNGTAVEVESDIAVNFVVSRAILP